MTTPAAREPRSVGETADVDALVVDRYLDSLLSGKQAAYLPDDLDPAVRHVVRRLRRDLVRVHPSFRFEERLAERLADAADGQKLRAAAGSEGTVISLAPPGSRNPADSAMGEGAGGIRPDPRPRFGPFTTRRPTLPDPAAVIAGLPRQLLIGGALTSAALSLAGAYVAFRGRPPRLSSPMARAARAAHEARANSGLIRAGAVGALRPATPGVAAAAGLAARARSRLH